MSEWFRPVDREQLWLMPPSMAEWLPDDHEVWFLIDLVEGLDLSAIEATYRLGRQGRAPLSPAMLVTLLVYGYSQGILSSRRLERACREQVAFRVICGNEVPDHSTIARFRQQHLVAVEDLFAQVLALCARAGLVQLGSVAVDGTKLRANASLGANRELERLRAIAAERLAEAEEIDAVEDDEFGDRRGDELPAGLASRQARQRRIRELLGELDERSEATGEPLPERVNTTDPDSRVMSSTRGYLQGYNAQVATVANQIVVAAWVSPEENDVALLVPMIERIEAMLALAGITTPIGTVLADAGYFTADAVETLDARQIAVLIATRKRAKQPTEPPQDPIEDQVKDWEQTVADIDDAKQAERQRRAETFDRVDADPDLALTDPEVLDELGLSQAAAYASWMLYRHGGVDAIRLKGPRKPKRPKLSRAQKARHQMETMLADPDNRTHYNQRAHLVETYFGNLKANKGIVAFTRRGLAAARAEWTFHATVNNIFKLHAATRPTAAT